MQIGKNELRRDPLSGSWTIVIKNHRKLADLLLASEVKSSNAPDFENIDKYITGEDIFSIPSGPGGRESWLVKVVAGERPVLQIHGALNNRGKGLYDVCDGVGAHEIVIESNQTGVPFEALETSHIATIFAAYSARILDLKKDFRFRYITVHKKQKNFTADTPVYPLSHIVATPITPLRIRLKLESCLQHFKYKERCLLCDIIYQEQESDERVIAENDSFIAISPFAALAPFHMIILPKDHEPFYEKNGQLKQLAEITKKVLSRLVSITGQNNYEILINSAPNLASAKRRGYWKTLKSDYHWHLEILPTLSFRNDINEDVGFPSNCISPEEVTRLFKQ